MHPTPSAVVLVFSRGRKNPFRTGTLLRKRYQNQISLALHLLGKLADCGTITHIGPIKSCGRESVLNLLGSMQESCLQVECRCSELVNVVVPHKSIHVLLQAFSLKGKRVDLTMPRSVLSRKTVQDITNPDLMSNSRLLIPDVLVSIFSYLSVQDVLNVRKVSELLRIPSQLINNCNVNSHAKFWIMSLETNSSGYHFCGMR